MPLDESANPAVRKALDDLLADHERQDGLSQEDVERVLAGRGIVGADSLAVYERLSEHGIEVRQAERVRSPAARRRARQVRMALAEEPALLGMLSHPIMSAQEEVVLGRRIAQAQRLRADLDAGVAVDCPAARYVLRSGDEARERFVRLNLRLVLSVARRHFKPGGLPLADLLQEGTIGLMQAVERFDHTRGYKFSTYATWWIRQAIARSIDDKAATIRTPVHMAEAVRKLRRTEARLRLGGPLPPTVRQLADEMQWDEARVVKVLVASHLGVVPLDPVRDADGEGGSLLDTMPCPGPNPEEITIERDLVAAVRAMLAGLTPRQERVLRMRFGLNMNTDHTLEEVGQQFAVTRERIRQVEAKALKLLRNPARSRRLRVFVGLA